METTVEQGKNKGQDNIKPFMWKKGQSGNIMGRPKGKTMKEYVKEYLARMTDEERDEWLEGLDKHEIWKLAEGNPETKGALTITETPQPILGGNAIPTDNSTKED